jgi:hypothetical protein
MVGKLIAGPAGQLGSTNASLAGQTTPVPYPNPTSPAASATMRANRRSDTGPERRLRSLLHASGYRFRKDEKHEPADALPEVHEGIPSLLGGPGSRRVGRHPQNVDAAAGDFHHKQHVQAPE